MDIKEALAALDTLEDGLWTSEGLPKVDVISELVGSTVTRQQITDAAPKFTRANADLGDVVQEQEQEQEQPEELIDELAMDEFFEGQPKLIPEVLAFLGGLNGPGVTEFVARLEEQLEQTTLMKKMSEEYDARVRQSLSFARSREKQLVPGMTDAEANRAYIDSQAQQRQARAEASAAILKGIDPTMLDPRSAIDRAMARKTARGGNRPNIPVTK